MTYLSQTQFENVTSTAILNITNLSITGNFDNYLYKSATTETIYKLNSYVDEIATRWYNENNINYRPWVTSYDCTDNTIHINCAHSTGYYKLPQYTVTSCYGSDANELISFTDLKRSTMLNKIKSNLVICVKSRAQDIAPIASNEQVAMDSLREVISETEFRRYLKYGFVLVKGKSGDTYQVLKNKSHTKIWRNGQVIEEVCVRLKGSVPATDNVIAFKTMIETDEALFKKCGNVFKMKAA